MKKFVFAAAALCSMLLCGCDNSKRIDKAVIIESIVVNDDSYKFIYISDEEKSESVRVEAESLEKALKTLKSEHKPEIVLAKLELIAFAENADNEKFYSTLQQIKNNYSVSPSVYTAVCSNEILRSLDEPKTLEDCKEQIMILEKKDKDISSTLLKMNNNLSKSKKSLLYFPYISSNDGITGEKIEIMIKK